MLTTKKRKLTKEVLGKEVREAEALSSIEEEEVISPEGIDTVNTVERAVLTCGHKYTGKEQGLVECSVCRGIWCGQCAEKSGSLCDGCGKWLCQKHSRVSILAGLTLCPECGLSDVIKKKLKGGGILKWLDWSS
ncbi:MAG: hypothetical protein QXN96_05480 [Candidatus Bathyarchaeia archaeon]